MTFHTSPQFWINLQSDYDLRIASKDVLTEGAANRGMLHDVSFDDTLFK